MDGGNQEMERNQGMERNQEMETNKVMEEEPTAVAWWPQQG